MELILDDHRLFEEELPWRQRDETGDLDAVRSGLAVGFFGLATLSWTRVISRFAGRLSKSALILIGGVLLALGYAIGATSQSFSDIALAAFIVGGGFALMHPTL